MESIRNIAFYKFIALSDPEKLRAELFEKAQDLGLKGTLIIAPEGVNGMLAGENKKSLQFETELKEDPRFTDVLFKVSFSSKIPFRKLLVRVKPEVLTLGQPEIKPAEKKPHYISPQELLAAFENKRDITLIDVRNDFEVEMGSFEGAINPKTKSFTDFVEFAKNLDLDKEKEIVTYCTGGIRCEKGALLLEREGFKSVRQLHGGILEYFSQIPGGPHFKGECFVFDERETLNPHLKARR